MTPSSALGPSTKRMGPSRKEVRQMEVGALRAFVETGLHNVDARLDQQADMLLI